eukprot:TRINITY_DN1623_c0_g1_i2.p1 TRINITY_DN1623_c0_g1~~TRINITY_DN1623_c0_g1_i2.p1  ORF type:complete len:352 (-),score=45.61 TRINITY_DN1623_c0_g1_i2:413-1468(-)
MNTGDLAVGGRLTVNGSSAAFNAAVKLNAGATVGTQLVFSDATAQTTAFVPVACPPNTSLTSVGGGGAMTCSGLAANPDFMVLAEQLAAANARIAVLEATLNAAAGGPGANCYVDTDCQSSLWCSSVTLRCSVGHNSSCSANPQCVETLQCQSGRCLCAAGQALASTSGRPVCLGMTSMGTTLAGTTSTTSTGTTSTGTTSTGTTSTGTTLAATTAVPVTCLTSTLVGLPNVGVSTSISSGQCVSGVLSNCQGTGQSAYVFQFASSTWQGYSFKLTSVASANNALITTACGGSYPAGTCTCGGGGNTPPMGCTGNYTAVYTVGATSTYLWFSYYTGSCGTPSPYFQFTRLS